MKIFDGDYTYPVFEANQVLKSEQLNEAFNYLEMHHRLTRVKLIGAGIVCGFEIKILPDKSIRVSKGSGLTSQGFIITACEKTYSHFLEYSTRNFPDDLRFLSQCNGSSPNPVPFYETTKEDTNLFKGKKLYQLLTQKEFEELKDEHPNGGSLAANNLIDLGKYAVVLFLETEQEDLKNCDTNDCNDKGSEMQFEVKALLVEKGILDELKRLQNDEVKVPVGNPTVTPDLHHVELRRYNVPVKDLKTADAVLDAFADLVDDSKLKSIAEVLNYCFVNYYYLLENETSNPFEKVWEKFKDLRNNIINGNHVLIQYFYDFIDDVLNAYYEFKHKVFEVSSACCNIEMKFPLHLMLGEAAADTPANTRSNYREYFIYSPLFNNQKEKLAEIRLLFNRMKLLVQEVDFDTITDFEDREVRITPSRQGYVYLSDKCIPYHYNSNHAGNELYRSWSFDKTSRGNERFNLGYNAWQYCSADNVVRPLIFDIERFNFFRIEGHIGKDISRALPRLKTIQQQNNLPFDVVALSADYIGALVKGEEPKCVIQDLESDYRVLIAEFICKMHDAYCTVAGLRYIPHRTFLFEIPFLGGINPGIVTMAEEGVPTAVKAEAIFDRTDLLNFKIDHPFVSTLVGKFHALKNYSKGDTLRDLCNPEKETIGRNYLDNHTKQFFNPVHFTGERDRDKLYHELFEYIDRVESMFATLMNNELADLNVNDLKTEYEKIISTINSIHRIVNDFSLPSFGIFSNPKSNYFEHVLLNIFVKNIQFLNQSCFIEQVEALKSEYDRRMGQYRLAKNFSYYFKMHGGIEHKAGVPRGGTFILVYHEKRRQRLIDNSSFFVNKELSNLMLSHFRDILKPNVFVDTLAYRTKLLETSLYYKEPELHLGFNNILKEYLDECKTLPDDKRKELEILISTPHKESHFELKDAMVIADFYIPYLCCSDCPPVVYMLPPPPKEETEDPTIKIKTNIFCSTDKNPYEIKVTPDKAIASGPGVSGDGHGNFVFIPAAAGTGFKTLISTLEGKPPAETIVEVVATPDAIFSYATEVGHGQVLLTLKNETTGKTLETTYAWFRDGKQFSEDETPEPFKFDEAKPVKNIKLIVSNGKCPGTDTKEIKIEREIVRRKIFLCSEMGEFPLEKPIGSVKVLDNSGIKMDDKNLIVFPVQTSVENENEFIVRYRNNNVETEVTITLSVPNADFIMTITAEENGTTIKLQLESADKNYAFHKWEINPEENMTDPQVDPLIYIIKTGRFGK